MSLEHAPAREAFSVASFCKAHGISRALFYKLLKNGNGPRTMKVANRTLISVEAARDWRSQMEAATAAAA